MCLQRVPRDGPEQSGVAARGQTFCDIGKRHNRKSQNDDDRDSGVTSLAHTVALQQSGERRMSVGCGERVERFQGGAHLAEGDAAAFAGEASDPADGRRLERRVIGLQHQEQDLYGVGQRDDAGKLARRRPYCCEITAGHGTVQAGADDWVRGRHLRTYVRRRAGRMTRGGAWGRLAPRKRGVYARVPAGSADVSTMAFLRHRRALVLSWLTTAVTALVCAAVLTAAILVPAPGSVLGVIVAVCVALPMLATWDLAQVSAAAGPRLDVNELRRDLQRLPETQHPLGL
jgi:hypothetical protein